MRTQGDECYVQGHSQKTWPHTCSHAQALTNAGLITLIHTPHHSQVSTAAEEAIDPGRSLPIGIVGSLSITTVLYVLM